MDIGDLVQSLGRNAKKASYKLATLTAEEKNRALSLVIKSLDENRSVIKAENALDLQAAREAELSKSLLDRLMLDDQQIDGMIESIESIIELPDPVGKLITKRTLKNGMELRKVRTPIGVIGIIFESRPNVVADVAALCIKSGNAVILRGGKEAEHSNRAIMKAIDEALEIAAFAPFAVQMVPITNRSAVAELAKLNNYIDLIIPRGGEALIEAIAKVATVPVIKHYKGVCHIYVDESADLDMALQICHNAKCQRPGVCNAAEIFLIHAHIAKEFLPMLYQRLLESHVEVRGDNQSISICPKIVPATESDWSQEYLDLIVSIKIVENLSDAIHHINHYGSHHSDAIVTNDKAAKLRFAKEVDSAAVYVNASTRFTDGFVFGLGAEMGISTDKLHARGPMGLEELCTYKWVGLGNGHIRT